MDAFGDSSGRGCDESEATEAGTPQEAPEAFDRRAFLSTTAKASLGLGGVALLTRAGALAQAVASAPRIAIVGGGIAGLNAAYQLSKVGLRATVYEASDTLGGRIRTARGLVAPDVYSELGGEFIDSSHADLIQLAREFHLPRYDRMELSERRLKQDDYFINGTRYTEQQVVSEFKGIAKSIKQDQDVLPKNVTYRHPGAARKYDIISVEEYFQQLGVRGWLLELLRAAYTSEFGLDVGEQSALNFLTMIGAEPGAKEFKVFGESDERFKIKGGNDLLIKRLGERLQDRIERGRQLQAMKGSGGEYVLSFYGGKEVKADIVILAIPFSVLRHVDLQLPLPPQKVTAIRELGYGTNAKLLLGFKERVWRSKGYSGYLINNILQNGWDHSQLQNGNAGSGGYTVFLGGADGLNLSESMAGRYLSVLDQAYGDATAKHNGSKGVFNWPSNPFSLGSYSCYKVGQWTGIGGAEIESVGNLFFAGEHCSRDFQGYMNGGAESGRMAAEAVRLKVRGHRRPSRARRAAYGVRR
ncbi:MAG: monoamine oxidase [Acidobacteriota bacterium]|nr:monoamine oxidase [Acidobacteriota bacterium]